MSLLNHKTNYILVLFVCQAYDMALRVLEFLVMTKKSYIQLGFMLRSEERRVGKECRL